jgi:hypothetical protein
MYIDCFIFYLRCILMCLLQILLRCMFDMYIHMYIAHAYYVFHIMLVVVV